MSVSLSQGSPKKRRRGRKTLSRRRTMLIKIRAVVLLGPRGGEGPPFIGGSRSPSEKILKVHFSVIYAVNTLIVWTIIDFLN